MTIIERDCAGRVQTEAFKQVHADLYLSVAFPDMTRFLLLGKPSNENFRVLSSAVHQTAELSSLSTSLLPSLNYRATDLWSFSSPCGVDVEAVSITSALAL